ncbi:unnamed protein product [Timema podura]|uniref:Cytochrome P450 n=1 Tax=Timema podura TaxID=61482 RepID=A0ABN7NYK2_TIMPD|nr:unnamed protein product [Timema podura]
MDDQERTGNFYKLRETENFRTSRGDWSSKRISIILCFPSYLTPLANPCRISLLTPLSATSRTAQNDEKCYITTQANIILCISANSGQEMETELSLSIILSTTAVIVFLYWYFSSTFSYWEKRGVPYVKPLPVFGNVVDYIFLRNTSAESYVKIYNKLEGHQFGGFYSGSTPNLILRDPLIIKQIMVKDFNHFIDRNLSFVEKISPLACHLFSLTGNRLEEAKSEAHTYLYFR